MKMKSKSLDPFVDMGFVTYKQVIGELGTMKYRREITKSTMIDVSWHIFRLFAEDPALRSEQDDVWHDRVIGQRMVNIGHYISYSMNFSVWHIPHDLIVNSFPYL